MSRSLITFLLIASFGVLFVGCSPDDSGEFEEFTITEDDMARVSDLVDETDALRLRAGSGSAISLTTLSGAELSAGTVTLDADAQRRYDGLRAGMTDEGNVYRVTNDFLNVRSEMGVGSAQVARLEQGDALYVTDIPNASWAKVKMLDGREGYVAFRYIAKVTTEEKLAAEKEAFKGKYFVNFTFLNVRREPNQQGEKIGELPGYAIVEPLHVSADWARVPFAGQEGYVSAEYLEPFEPAFLVRQENYAVPILRYRATDPGILDTLQEHVAGLKAAGKNIVTLQSLRETVLQQELRDTRVAPGTVVLTVTDVTPENVKAVLDALNGANVNATIFVASKHIGISGVTEKMILTLMANGHELQSGGHTGDDLRALTDSQVTLELAQSKKLIEEMTHKEVYAVAYPQGGANDRVMAIAAQAGYLFGVGQVPDTTFDRTQFLRLPSVYVGASLTADDVVGLLQ